MSIAPASDTRSSRLVDLRRHFHQHPERSYQEHETAQSVIAELDRLGVDHRYDGPGSGVVGRLVGPDPGPTIALRAEMDALPCAERTGLPFASDVPGLMHACGHDAHMAMVLGAADRLAASPPRGTVLFVFQPAEETGNGSCAMLESGHLADVDAIFAAHVTRHHEVGQILVTPGTITAQADRFGIRIRGQGGHGARPHEAVDAVVVASLLITAIQTLVSRESNPVHPSVVTVGTVRAGTGHNVIAEDAELEGTIRTTRPEARRQLMAGLERMAHALGELHNANISVEFGESAPPVVNSARETDVARAAAEAVVGTGRVAAEEHPSMGAEDFSYYLDAMPGCYVRLGARPPGGEYFPLHSPQFDVDEAVLEIGAAYFETVARGAARTLAGEG